MKQILFALSMMLVTLSVKAQSFTINNTTDCTFYFKVEANDPTCTMGVATILYTIPPHSSLFFASFAAASWGGSLIPGPGWAWNLIVVEGVPGASCGPFIPGGAPPSCGSNMVQMGSGACYPVLNVGCMDMNTSPGCNTCKYTRDEWINMPGGDVIVNMG